MISAINFRNAHESGAILPKMFDFRHRVFIEETGYDVTTFDGMEYDRYDTPATVYFISQDKAGEVRGVVRAAPTDRPYMIEEVWPGLVQGALPRSATTFEASRIGIDSTLDYNERRQIRRELVLAKMEFGIMAGVTSYIGVMPVKFWQSVYRNSGWPVRYLGNALTLPDGMEVLAGEFLVSKDALQNIRAVTGITESVLKTPIENIYKSEHLRRTAFNAAAAGINKNPRPDVSTQTIIEIVNPMPGPS